MKTFLLSILIFITIFILATANAVTFCKRSAEIITALETLPDTPTEQHKDHILNLWKENKRFFNLTTSHAATDKIDAEMCILKNANSADELMTCRDILMTLLIDMKDSASVSLNGIF